MSVMEKLWRMVRGGPRDPHEGMRVEFIEPAIPGPDESQAARERQHGHTVEGILAIVRRALKSHKPGWPVRVFIRGEVPDGPRLEADRELERMGYTRVHIATKKGLELTLSPAPTEGTATTLAGEACPGCGEIECEWWANRRRRPTPPTLTALDCRTISREPKPTPAPPPKAG